MSDARSDEVVVLPEYCNMAQVENLHGLLSGAVRAGRLKIDASQVRTADTAGVQLLLAMQKRLAGEGGAIEWVGMSDLLRQAATDLGLADLVASRGSAG